MKRWVVVSILGLGLVAPSVSMACGMYFPSPEGKTLAMADALEAIDAEVETEKVVVLGKKAEVKPEDVKAKKDVIAESEKKPNS